MASVQFDLVSPERSLATLEATEVQIPGADGDMTAMAAHAPTITTLRPGILSVTHAGGTDDYVVSGGFAQIAPDAVSVLAEQAMPKGEVTQDMFTKLVEEARAAAERAAPEAADDAAKLVADVVAMGAELGLSA